MVREDALVMSKGALIILVVLVALLGIIAGVVLSSYLNAQQSGSGGEGEMGPYIASWRIYVDGEETKIIHASTLGDGRAVWSGEIKIAVYDQSLQPLAGVSIVLDGCGISYAASTDSNGTATIYAENVTLQSGMQTGEIHVTLTYVLGDGTTQIMNDSLTVVRE